MVITHHYANPRFPAHLLPYPHGASIPSPLPEHCKLRSLVAGRRLSHPKLDSHSIFVTNMEGPRNGSNMQQEAPKPSAEQVLVFMSVNSSYTAFQTLYVTMNCNGLLWLL